MSMLQSHLQDGIFAFHCVKRIALIIFCVFTITKCLVKRKYEFKPLDMVCEFGWILTVLLILKITGIIYGNFGTNSIFDKNVQFSFELFQGGLTPATILNLILFIPFGLFSVLIFKKLKEKWVYGILIGLTFSLTIEILQIFAGRFAELEDVLMNTIGTFIGYLLGLFLSKLKQKIKNKINFSLEKEIYKDSI